MKKLKKTDIQILLRFALQLLSLTFFFEVITHLPDYVTEQNWRFVFFLSLGIPVAFISIGIYLFVHLIQRRVFYPSYINPLTRKKAQLKIVVGAYVLSAISFLFGLNLAYPRVMDMIFGNTREYIGTCDRKYPRKSVRVPSNHYLILPEHGHVFVSSETYHQVGSRGAYLDNSDKERCLYGVKVRYLEQTHVAISVDILK